MSLGLSLSLTVAVMRKDKYMRISSISHIQEHSLPGNIFQKFAKAVPLLVPRRLRETPLIVSLSEDNISLNTPGDDRKELPTFVVQGSEAGAGR